MTAFARRKGVIVYLLMLPFRERSGDHGVCLSGGSVKQSRQRAALDGRDETAVGSLCRGRMMSLADLRNLLHMCTRVISGDNWSRENDRDG